MEKCVQRRNSWPTSSRNWANRCEILFKTFCLWKKLAFNDFYHKERKSSVVPFILAWLANRASRNLPLLQQEGSLELICSNDRNSEALNGVTRQQMWINSPSDSSSQFLYLASWVYSGTFSSFNIISFKPCFIAKSSLGYLQCLQGFSQWNIRAKTNSRRQEFYQHEAHNEALYRYVYICMRWF